MHISFLDYLVDPCNHEPLALHCTKRDGDFIIQGTLSSSQNQYKIIRGIPRFAGFDDVNNYTNSFGYQWCKWSRLQFECENVGEPMEGHTRGMWEKITGIEQVDLNRDVFLESGCGPGRFLDVVLSKNGRAIGIDLSDAVEAAQENFSGNPNVLICQGDSLNLPIKSQAVDGAFSIGVFHHTSKPEKGCCELVRSVRPSGKVAVCVYAKGSYYDFPTVTLYRKLFKILWPYFAHYPPLLYSYFTAYGLRMTARIPVLGKLLRFLFPYVNLPDAKWSLLDTFDSVTPTYQSTHDGYEVFHWLKDNNVTDIEPSQWGNTAFRGQVSPEENC